MFNKNVQNISISTTTILKVILILLALIFLWLIRDVILMLFVSVILVALIDPFADWMQRHKIPRAFSVLIIYVILLALVALILFLLIPPIVEELGKLAQNVGYYWEQLTIGLHNIKGFTVSQGIPTAFERGVEALQTGLSGAVGRVFGTVAGLFGGLAAMIIVLVITFYMVAEEDSIKRMIKSLASEKYQPFFTELAAKIKGKIGLWLRGQIILSLIVGVFTYIALKILGVEYALVLALFAAFTEFIPYLGPVLAAIPAIFLALIQSPFKAFLVLIIYIVIQQVENNLLVPKIMQKTVGLNPVASIIALLVGVKLAGLVGAILAIPVAIVISLVWREIYRQEKTV
ncbi:AI-2E family transporter [Patescibacteria group bacterium]|nr:AI-2E family transporter [Patescibacteria group bacterium]MBU1921945.1 AI-2E family transporter [Patescibacteria group bacterium]